MATIKSFTSLEQSKKLAEILPLESADMWWAWYSSPFDNGHYDDFPMFCKPICNTDKSVPCWSFAALLSVLKYPSLLQNVEEKWFVSEWTGKHPKVGGLYDNPVDACYEMILKLHELNLL